MKRLLRNIGELFALWIVVATILLIGAWLVVPQVLSAPDDNIPNAVSTLPRSA